MKVFLLAAGMISALFCCAQNIPPDVNTIIIKKVGFTEVCNALLDSGYSIEKKDADLQTVRTEPRPYPKYWNATYIINIRVKDSTAYISGISKSAIATAQIFNQSNKLGITHPKSMFGYPFLILNSFAQSFKKEVTYEKK